MDVDAALKKIFAKLDELGERVDKLDPNGRLDKLQCEMEKVTGNGQMVVSLVREHGTAIAVLQTIVTELRCRQFPSGDTKEIEPVDTEEFLGTVEQ
jgi:hypothetical protein